MVTRSAPDALVATPHHEAASQVATLGTILGVWAHPDDDTYLSAGVMRLALENRQRVICVTATAGEQGTNGSAVWTPGELADIRRSELEASLDALSSGLVASIEHRWLDHPDQGCAEVSAAVGASEIGDIIDRVRPDTVITFDPGGMTGHPDHQAVASWTALAVADRPGVTQLEAVVTRSWVDRVSGSIDLTSYFERGYPSIVDDQSTELNLVLGDDLWSVKDRALRAHDSQVGELADALGEDLWRAFNVSESFSRATSTQPPTNKDQGP